MDRSLPTSRLRLFWPSHDISVKPHVTNRISIAQTLFIVNMRVGLGEVSSFSSRRTLHDLTRAARFCRMSVLVFAVCIRYRLVSRMTPSCRRAGPVLYSQPLEMNLEAPPNQYHWRHGINKVAFGMNQPPFWFTGLPSHIKSMFSVNFQ